MALGAAEANHLGMLLLGVKYFVAKEIEKKPIKEQAPLWNQYGAFAHGASVNNLCIIGSILTSGSFAPFCPILGFISGKQYYDSNEEKINQILLKNEEELFDEICQKEKLKNQNINCIYKIKKEAFASFFIVFFCLPNWKLIFIICNASSFCS